MEIKIINVNECCARNVFSNCGDVMARRRSNTSTVAADGILYIRWNSLSWLLVSKKSVLGS